MSPNTLRGPTRSHEIHFIRLTIRYMSETVSHNRVVASQPASEMKRLPFLTDPLDSWLMSFPILCVDRRASTLIPPFGERSLAVTSL